MSVEEPLLFFLAIPAVAYGLAVVWPLRAMRAAAVQDIGLMRRPEAIGRYLLFTTMFATPVVYGSIMVILLLDVPESPTSNAVIRSLGTMFAVAAALTALSAAWVLARRSAVAYGVQFGRVLILAVVPQSLIIFALIVAILILGRLPGPSDLPLGETEARTLTLAAGYMIAGAAGAPLIAVGANREASLEGQGPLRALFRTFPGQALLFLALALSILELRSA